MQALIAIFLHHVAIGRQNADKGVKSSLRPWKDNHDRNGLNESLLFTATQYVYFDLPSKKYFRHGVPGDLVVQQLYVGKCRTIWDNQNISDDYYKWWRQDLKYLVNEPSYIGAIGESRKKQNVLKPNEPVDKSVGQTRAF